MALVSVLWTGGAWAQSSNMDDYVVFAEQLVRFGSVNLVASGNVGVNDPGGMLIANSRLASADGSHLVADGATIKGPASLYSLLANQPALRAGVNVRSAGEPVGWPPPIMSPFPTVPPMSPGTQVLKLSRGMAVTLPAGNYGQVKMQAKATLVFTGGTYTFDSWKVASTGRLLFTAPTVVNIANSVGIGSFSVVGPLGPTMTADDITINVAGPKVKIRNQVTIAAKIVAPTSTLKTGLAGLIKGQIVAMAVRFGSGTVVQQAHPPGVFGTHTRTPTTSATPTNTPTMTSIPTVTATQTPSETATRTPTPTPTDTATPTATDTPVPTATSTPFPTATSTSTNTPLPPTATNTPVPSRTATSTSTKTPKPRTPTATPTMAVCGDGVVEPGEECDDGNTECDDGCSDDCRDEVNLLLGSQFCTLTQGAWDAPNGIANGPNGFVTLNPGILPVTIGGVGQSTTVHSQSALEAYLPAGGPPGALLAGDRDFYTAADVVPDGGGVLRGQTMALSLAVNLSNLGATFADLSTVVLPDVSFCTQGLLPGNDGVLGTADDELDPGSSISGPWHLPNSVAVANNTVADVLLMANQYLRGGTSAAPIGDVNNAETTLNEAFDGCRRVVKCPDH